METRPPGGGMQQRLGAGGTALLGRQSVVGSRGGRVYVKSSRVVATMGGVGRWRTGRNSCRFMSASF